MARGAAAYLAGQAANRVVGLETHFSWKAMAATVAGYAGGSVIADSLRVNELGKFLGGAARSTLVGSATGKFTKQWAGGADVNYGQIALDAFGNQLGRKVGKGLSGLGKPKVGTQASFDHEVAESRQGVSEKPQDSGVQKARATATQAMGSQNDAISQQQVAAVESSQTPNTSSGFMNLDLENIDWSGYDPMGLNASFAEGRAVYDQLSARLDALNGSVSAYASDTSVYRPLSGVTGTITPMTDMEAFLEFHPVGETIQGVLDNVEAAQTFVPKLLVEVGALRSDVSNFIGGLFGSSSDDVVLNSGLLRQAIENPGGLFGDTVKGFVHASPLGVVDAFSRGDYRSFGQGASALLSGSFLGSRLLRVPNSKPFDFSGGKPILTNDSFSPDIVNQRSAEFYKLYGDNPSRGR